MFSRITTSRFFSTATIAATAALGIASLLPAPAAAFDVDGYSCFVPNYTFRGTSTGSTTVGVASYVKEDPTATVNDFSAQRFKTSQIAILVRENDYGDGLSSSTLAGTFNAPILFTNSNQLSPSAQQALVQLQVKHVVIIGGTKAISPQVQDTINGMGMVTERLSGTDRFNTALEIAKKATGSAAPKTVYFVEGANANPQRGWPDAVNISAIAANTNSPILPVMKDSMPPQIAAQWEAWAKQGAQPVVVGGRASVGEAVENQIARTSTKGITRIAGSNRNATSNEALRYGLDHAGLSMGTVYMVPDDTFVYGLAAGAVGAHTNNPVQMMSTTTAQLPVLYKLAKVHTGTKELAFVGPFTAEVGALVNRAVTGRTIVSDQLEQSILRSRSGDELNRLLKNSNAVRSYTRQILTWDHYDTTGKEAIIAERDGNIFEFYCDWGRGSTDEWVRFVYNKAQNRFYESYGPDSISRQGWEMDPYFEFSDISDIGPVSSVTPEVYQGEPVYKIVWGDGEHVIRWSYKYNGALQYADWETKGEETISIDDTPPPLETFQVKQ